MNIKRTYYIFKCRAHVLASHCIERVLHTLSKWGLIVEHKNNYTTVLEESFPKSLPDLTSERFVFNLSYKTSLIRFVDEYWFENKKGKVLYTVWSNHHEERRLSFRAELKSFYAHISHKNRMWVHYNDNSVLDRCAFSKCRYAYEISLTPETLIDSASEVLSESCRVFKWSLTSKIPEINKTLTGADNDGELTSPSGCPLVDNLICRKCGYPVFAVPDNRYTFECVNHGELKFCDIDKVDPKLYEGNLNHCLTELERFCECPQD